MPQVQLPIFPAGSVEINRELACRVEGEQVVYFNGHLPVFAHAKSDLASFRLFTSQLIVQGSATQGHVAKAFGVPLVAIKRATKLYRERGPAGFFVSGPRREGSKLNGEKLELARALLVQGYGLPVVSTDILTCAGIKLQPTWRKISRRLVVGKRVWESVRSWQRWAPARSCNELPRRCSSTVRLWATGSGRRLAGVTKSRRRRARPSSSRESASRISPARALSAR